MATSFELFPTPSWARDDDHGAFLQSVRQFYAKEMLPNLARWRDQGAIDRAFWNMAGDIGILGASIPSQYGGSGLPLTFDALAVLEQARMGDMGWGLTVHNIVVHYVLTYGSEEQKQKWLPKLASGEFVGAIAMTEPSTGSDLQSITTHAELVEGSYVLNGSKTFISNGQHADLICVVAKTDRNAGARGISLIFVEAAETVGFERGRNLKKIGLKRQDTSELFFQDARVPRENLLGHQEGGGFAQLMQQLPWERLLIGIMAQGQIEAALKLTLAYMGERQVFGRPLMSYQNTRFSLAEIASELEALRAFLDCCVGWAMDGALSASKASMAKLLGTELQCKAIDQCLQLFGGYGFMEEYPISELYTDARVQRIYGGTSEIMKEVIARDLERLALH